MKGPEYIQVRLLRSTYDRLQAFLERRKGKAAKRPHAYRPAMSKTRVSVADAIDELLFIHDNEKARKDSWYLKRVSERKAREDLPISLELDRMAEEGCPNHT